MNRLVAGGGVAFQDAPGLAEGLPYWILWFLLCVILLLLVVIFLRDKNLRRKLSSFLSGAKRRMLRLRLQSKLRAETLKKAGLWKELGKKAWAEDVMADCVSEECRKLSEFEEELHVHQMTWHEIYSRIESLGKEHEKTVAHFRALIMEQEDARRPIEEERRALADRKSEVLDAIGGASWEIDSSESQIKALDSEAWSVEGAARLSPVDKAARLNKIQEKASALVERVKALQAQLPLLHEERQGLEKRHAEAEAKIGIFNEKIGEIEARQRLAVVSHEQEIREWLKNKERVQDRIVEIQRLMEPLFESMGRALDESRIDQGDLPLVYFRIDAVNKKIREIEEKIEHLA